MSPNKKSESSYLIIYKVDSLMYMLNPETVKVKMIYFQFLKAQVHLRFLKNQRISETRW